MRPERANIKAGGRGKEQMEGCLEIDFWPERVDFRLTRLIKKIVEG